MKFTLLLLIPLIAVLVIGCQDNSPIGATSPGTENPMLVKDSPVNEPIDFSYLVRNPYKPAQDLLEVSGTIQFQILPSPILSKEVYDLSCVIEGQVYSINPKDLMGSTVIKSFDQIEFSFQDKAILIQKSILVDGVKNPLLMNITLMVYPDIIEVSNVWLTMPDIPNEK